MAPPQQQALAILVEPRSGWPSWPTVGPASFRLDDGTRWHAGCLRKMQAPPCPGLGVPAATVLTAAWFEVAATPAPQAQPGVTPPGVVVEGRPARAHTRPGHVRDFVTEYHT